MMFFTLMFREYISKIYNFSRTAGKKATMRRDNAAVSGSIADPSNFMSDCKQMQVRLKNESTSIWNERNIKETCCKIGLNYVGESSRKSSVKQCP